MKVPTVLICPGNGCSNIRRSNWYGVLHDQLNQAGIPSICEDFPDPHAARRSIWIPHMRKLVEKNCLGDPTNVILVGHSSGAQAVLRYAEEYTCAAAVLVAATYTDLGDAGERASGYYPQAKGKLEENPYLFEMMKKNCAVWHQFHSDDDPFIPLAEAERIRSGLGLMDEHYHMLPGRSHFFEPFVELMDVIQSIVEDSSTF
ncbi:putative hydrolase rbbp9 [Mayamaea pseudoterrestris]|nr:putative hydrolase rbbp9 [Mayamaea pseudoterrestris]